MSKEKIELIKKIVDAHLTKTETQEVFNKAKLILDRRKLPTKHNN